MHAEVGLTETMIASVRAAIKHVRASAEQLPETERRTTLLGFTCQRIVGQIGLPVSPAALPAAGELLPFA